MGEEQIPGRGCSNKRLRVGLTLPDGVDISSVKLYKAAAPTTPITLAEDTNYTVTAAAIQFVPDQLTTWGAESKIEVEFSDGKKNKLTIK